MQKPERKNTTPSRRRGVPAGPIVPDDRKVADSAGVTHTIPFNPDRAESLLSLKSFDHVIESVAFWHKQLLAQSCPECGVKGTLEVMVSPPYSIDVRCQRIESERCHYEQEILLQERD